MLWWGGGHTLVWPEAKEHNAYTWTSESAAYLFAFTPCTCAAQRVCVSLWEARLRSLGQSCYSQFRLDAADHPCPVPPTNLALGLPGARIQHRPLRKRVALRNMARGGVTWTYNKPEITSPLIRQMQNTEHASKQGASRQHFFILICENFTLIHVK